MAVPIVALYGALNAILNIVLAANVSCGRGKYRVSIGTGDSKEMLRVNRIHGNNAEFVPLALVMLLIVELMKGSSLWLHVLGGALFVARLSHWQGMMMEKSPNAFRFLGTAVTWLVILGSAIYAIILRS
jgi:uncharacterized protein